MCVQVLLALVYVSEKIKRVEQYVTLHWITITVR